MNEEQPSYRKPEGKSGQTLFDKMDKEHTPVSLWSIQHINIKEDDTILDIGCGSGLNVKRLHQLSPKNKTYGIDYSTTSIERAKKLNQKEINNNEIEIIQANVEEMPFEDNTFDIITAFETVYFWPSLTESFKEVKRILKPDGQFAIILDANGIFKEELKEVEKQENCKFYTDKELTQYLQKAEFPHITVYNRKRINNTLIIKTFTNDEYNEKTVNENINDNYNPEDKQLTPEWLCIISQK